MYHHLLPLTTNSKHVHDCKGELSSSHINRVDPHHALFENIVYENIYYYFPGNKSVSKYVTTKNTIFTETRPKLRVIPVGFPTYPMNKNTDLLCSVN